MIELEKSGLYKLAETRANVKILYLDNQAYAWVEPKNIGEILVISHKPHRTDCVLSIGHYQLFRVIDEPYLSDHLHLELEVGVNCWQGYLLLSGVPNKLKKRGRIIPTHEIISGNPRYKRRSELNSDPAQKSIKR